MKKKMLDEDEFPAHSPSSSNNIFIS